MKVKKTNETIGNTIVSGALHSLHEDLKGFQEMKFLTLDAKRGLGIAIEQVERYIRGDLEARQQSPLTQGHIAKLGQ